MKTLVERIDHYLNESKQYRYGVPNRPIGFATVPEGYTDVERDSRFRHGVVVYNKPPAQTSINNFELVPLVSLADFAKEIADKMGRYAKNYLEDADMLKDKIKSVIQYDIKSAPIKEAGIDELIIAVTAEILK